MTEDKEFEEHSNGNDKIAFEMSREFQFLRPRCINVLKEPSPNNLHSLSTAVKEIENVVPQICDYVLFPFGVHLKSLLRYKENERICIWQTLVVVLKRCEVQSYGLFVELYERCIINLSDPSDPSSLNNNTAEMETEAILDCLNALVEKSIRKHIAVFYSKEKSHIVGHSIFILLKIVDSVPVKILKLKSQSVLKLLVESCGSHAQYGRQFYCYLPGFVTNLRTTCNSQSGRLHKDVLINSVALLKQIIATTVVHVEKESLQEPDLNLSYVFQQMSEDLALHSEILFRESIGDLALTLVPLAVSKLLLCSEILLKIVLIQSQDKSLKTSHRCKTCLSTLPKQFLSEYFNFETLKKETQLAIISWKNNNESQTKMSILTTSAILSNFKLNFMELRNYLPLVFSFFHDLIWNERSINQMDHSWCDLNTLPFSTELSQFSLSLLQSCSTSDFIEEILPFLTPEANDLLGVIVLLNEILKILSQHQKSETIEQLNELEIGHISSIYVSILDSESNEITLKEMNSAVPCAKSLWNTRKAFLLAGIEYLTLLNSRIVMPLTLYSLLENGANEDSLVSDSAKHTLSQISVANNLDIPEFLNANIDLILSELSVRVTNLSLHPKAPAALLYLGEHIDFSKGAYGPFIDQVFSQSCDILAGGKLQLVYSQIFYAFMSSLWTHHKTNDSVEVNVSLSHESVNSKTLLERMLDYQSSLGLNLDNADVCDEASDSDNKQDDEDKEIEHDAEMDEEEKISPELNLASKICYRVLNFLPNENRAVKLLAMDSLTIGVKLLKNHQNQLLPLVHTIWQNISTRLEEKDYVLVRKCYEMIIALCESAGSFLRKRTVEEIFPKLSTMLETLAIESAAVKDKNRVYYTFTQGYKLQLTVLQGVYKLCSSLDITGEELDKVVSACIMYLGKDQHKNLQEAARNALQSFSKGPHRQIIWMKLWKHGIIEIGEKPDSSFVDLPSR